MMAGCPTMSDPMGFARRVLDFVDCQTQAIGGGYLALTAPGSTVSLAINGLLTLFVALLGYRLLLGQTPDMREGTMAFVKIGFVLALALGWPAYRILLFDVALHGPAELAASIGGAAGLPGAGGGLVDRIDTASAMLTRFAEVGPGDLLPEAARVQAPPPFSGFDTFAIGFCRLFFLLGAVGSLAAVHLVAGILLSLGPLFIALLLFDNTRGLFEGWVRVLLGAAIGALGAMIVIGVELALLEPWLAQLLVQRSAGYAIPSAPAELLVVSLIFVLIQVAMVGAAGRLALGFRILPTFRMTGRQRMGASLQSETQMRAMAAAQAAAADAPPAGRSRAAAVAQAVARDEDRGGSRAVVVESGSGGGRRAGPAQAAESAPGLAPLGQGFRRRTSTRVSASAARRDRGR